MNEPDQEKQALPTPSAPATTPPSRSDTVLADRTAEAPVTREDVAQQVDATRQQLLELQRKREELEREKNELEELRRKQDEYEQGRREMLERLTRSLVILEHEEVSTQRRAENIRNARASFASLKQRLEAIREDQWNNANLKAELTRALALVDTARDEYNHYRARIEELDEKRPAGETAAAPALPGGTAAAETWLAKASFGDLVKLGFALTLPLVVLGALLLIVLAAR